MCCGNGSIALALAKGCPTIASAVGCDNSAEAIALAHANQALAEISKAEFVLSDGKSMAAVRELQGQPKFDLIVGNIPRMVHRSLRKTVTWCCACFYARLCQ